MRTSRNLLSSGLAAAAGLAISATAGAQQLAIVNNLPGTFIDISSTGTALTGSADDSIHTFTSTVGNAIFPAGPVSVCTNGFMCAGTATGTGYGNVAIPASALPVPAAGTAWTSGTQGYMLPWWDDLYTITGGGSTTLYWQEINGTLIVQWHNIGHYVGVAGQTIDYEVKIFGTVTNGLYAQYLYSDATFGGTQAQYNNAADATIGYCHDSNPNSANVQWSLNTASIQDGAVLSIVPAVTGACCLPSGSCAEGHTNGSCAASGGVFQGENSTCVNVTCPQPGACCLTDGTCAVLQAGACAAQGGTYGGSGSSCATACPNALLCYTVTGLSVAIQDSPAGGTPGPVADATLIIAGSDTISSMKARIHVTHSYQGDLRVELVHPDSTSIDLVARPGVTAPKFSNNTMTGFPSNDLGGPGATDWMTFEDTAAGVYDDSVGFPGPPAGTVVTGGVANPTGSWLGEDGNATVTSLNTTFGGKNTAGTWHLRVTDHWPIDTGSINGISLCFTPSGGSQCYANCDGSTIQPCLNVQDFGCFLNRFSNGDSYANCDNSTIAPILNVQDFGCFLNKFSNGCSNC